MINKMLTFLEYKFLTHISHEFHISGMMNIGTRCLCIFSLLFQLFMK